MALTATAATTCAGTLIVFAYGCNARPLAGASVAIDAAGSPAASGTTDAAGSFAATVQPGVAYTIAVSYAPRFQPMTRTATVPAAGDTASVTFPLSPAAGYHCATGGGSSGGVACALPLNDTLHATDGVLGSATLSYSAAYGGWVGTSTYDWPWANICFDQPAGGPVALTWYFGCPTIPGGITYDGGVVTWQADVRDDCPCVAPEGACSGAHSYPGDGYNAWSTATPACPPALSASYTLTFPAGSPDTTINPASVLYSAWGLSSPRVVTRTFTE